MAAMTMDAAARSKPGAGVWTGRVMSGLVVAFLLLDATMKLIQRPEVAASAATLGWPADSAVPLGLIVLACAVFYAIPRTAVLGAILLTGLLGGAVATHMRIGSPLFSHILFGVSVGVIAWGGLWLRDPRVRALVPLRRGS